LEEITAIKGISPKTGGFSGRIRVEDILPEPGKKEEELFLRVINDRISEKRLEEIECKGPVYPGVKKVMALHWHPEFVPVETALRRFKRSFPDADESLFIPTQHNEILSSGIYSGMEIDCYSAEFKRKIQLLVHFKDFNPGKYSTLVSMADRTFKYRSSQMFELLDCICRPFENTAAEAAALTSGSSNQLLKFTAVNALKFSVLFDKHRSKIAPGTVKNKLIRNYFDELGEIYEARAIRLAQIFIKEAKEEIKRRFGNSYFFNAQNVIEEARAAGAGIIVPHPEQFWPILLAGYDVDGYEVWNPQSREYTEFLIGVIGETNKSGRSRRKLLVFMGDDTHMGEKARPPELRQPEKAGREIGHQPAWEEEEIVNKLKEYGFSRENTIIEYKSRLG
jgi:hypothetical protein